jgi:hypothetical protein
MLRLKKELLVLVDGMQHLSSSHVVFFCSSLVAVDVAAILVLNISALLSQGCTFLFPSLLGGETFSVGGNETIVLFVEPSLTLLKAFPLLGCSRDVGLYTLNLALDLFLGLVELARDGVLVVTFLLPLSLLGCSFLSLLFGNSPDFLCLECEFGSGFIRLADILRKLKDTLALAFVATSGIG